MSENIVSEILVREGMPPEELAERVNESALTVAKWRQGEQIPTEVWKKLSEQFSWIKDPVNILCRNSEVAEGWRELLKNVAEPLDLDWEFSYWNLAYIAELLSDLGMDVTTSVAQQATAVAERTDGCNALSLGEILSDMIQNSCWGAQYAYYAADWDDHDELIDDSYAVSDTARDWAAVRWLSERQRAALGLDDELWSQWCGNTRLRLREAVDVYLEKRGALGLQVEIDPHALESHEPVDLICDLQDFLNKKQADQNRTSQTRAITVFDGQHRIAALKFLQEQDYGPSGE